MVPGTSLGDVHTLLLYPVIASHRDVAPKLRARQGIRDNLVRISAGIEAIADIKADLDAALKLGLTPCSRINARRFSFCSR